MFGPVKQIVGAYRAYTVRDRVAVHEVLENVRSVQPQIIVHTLQWRDLSKIESQSTVIAVNPAGRQSHLVLKTLGGRSAAFLVHMPTLSVDLVPIRFSRQTHDKCTVLQCTVCARDRTIVVNDVISPPCNASSVSERIRRVHEVVHSHHVPDAAVFPMRIVARRCFSLAQMPDLKRYLVTGNVVYHSLAVISPPDQLRELRIRMDAPAPTGRSRDKLRLIHAIGDVVDVPVVATQGPDSYKFRLDPSSDWKYLSVRSIEESMALDALDLSTPTICRLIWDGATWRIALAFPVADGDPAHAHEKSENRHENS